MSDMESISCPPFSLDLLTKDFFFDSRHNRSHLQLPQQRLDRFGRQHEGNHHFRQLTAGS